MSNITITKAQMSALLGGADFIRHEISFNITGYGARKATIAVLIRNGWAVEVDGQIWVTDLGWRVATRPHRNFIRSHCYVCIGDIVERARRARPEGVR